MGGGGVHTQMKRQLMKGFSSLQKKSSFVNKIDPRPVNFEYIAFAVNTIRLGKFSAPTIAFLAF